MAEGNAPGAPGMTPRWTSSRKSGVGTALTSDSLVWFSISHGIFNELYWPRVDKACTRDIGMAVTDGMDFFSEEKRHADSQTQYMAEGVPAYKIISTCKQGRYQIEKEILTDPRRDTVLQFTRFKALAGKLEDYRLYLLAAPHLDNKGLGNTAWVGDYKGVPMLFARRNGNSMAIACSAPWLRMSAGYVGASDGWQDLHRNKRMTWEYERAEDGNVALTGEVDINEAGAGVLIAIGFGSTEYEAGNRARASLQDGFELAKDAYVKGWQDWQNTLTPIEEEAKREKDLYRISTAVMRVHEAKKFEGGYIAGLSIPWGIIRGDDDLGGYHLIWPRDMVETASAMLAAGARHTPLRVLHYLQATQEADGHWPQNMWLDGSAYWDKVQMDETALPILLIDLARRNGAIDEVNVKRFWPVVRLAASYIVKNGPISQQDRWEEDPGYSPFTLAAEIAGLLAAADIADLHGDRSCADYMRETADLWNGNIERWIYARDTGLAREYGVDGYYVRIAIPDKMGTVPPYMSDIPIRNRPTGHDSFKAGHIVSPDALALVRFGLRAADDPRILNTVKIMDDMLKVDTPYGTAWHRYDEDGYGEHEDGSPFDGTGIGRAWPLLTGERGHYELAKGDKDYAGKLLHDMETLAGDGGLLSEQVWDTDDIPEKELVKGRPSGSAKPLVWAHAEYIKLRRSIKDGRVFDMPPQPVQRYIVEKTGTPFAAWRYNQKCRGIPAGKVLRIEVLAPVSVHWSADGWNTVKDTAARDTGLGVFVADLPTDKLPSGTKVVFTFYWLESRNWEGTDFEITIE